MSVERVKHQKFQPDEEGKMSTSKSKTNVAGDAATAKTAGVTEQVQDTISDHAETAQLHVMKLGDQITKFMRKQPVTK